MRYLIKFLESEKYRNDVIVQKYPNREKLIVNKHLNPNVLHSFFKPLDEQ